VKALGATDVIDTNTTPNLSEVALSLTGGRAPASKETGSAPAGATRLTLLIQPAIGLGVPVALGRPFECDLSIRLAVAVARSCSGAAIATTMFTTSSETSSAPVALPRSAQRNCLPGSFGPFQPLLIDALGHDLECALDARDIGIGITDVARKLPHCAV
jgi:hypothetical protein